VTAGPQAGSEADTFHFDDPHNGGVDTIMDFQADRDTLLFFCQTFGIGVLAATHSASSPGLPAQVGITRLGVG
jgi:hypothetical protein